MSIVLWIGNRANHRALACKIHDLYGVSGIVIENRREVLDLSPGKIWEKLFIPCISEAWKGMLAFYGWQYKNYPDVPILEVENINDPSVLDFTKNIKPDLIAVSGTRLIKEPVMSIEAPIGIVNLHSGLSPYVKGGPNSTNWCIANNTLHLIGNTIMWIDKGIDSGNLVTTETIDFTGDESLLELHIKVMEHAHGLYLKAIEKLIQGISSNVPQKTIDSGKTFMTRQWGLQQKMAMVRNFKSFKTVIKSLQYAQDKAKVITVKI